MILNNILASNIFSRYTRIAKCIHWGKGRLHWFSLQTFQPLSSILCVECLPSAIPPPLLQVSTFLSAVGSISSGPWLLLGKPWCSRTWQHLRRTSLPSRGEGPVRRSDRQDPTLECKLVCGLRNELDMWALHEWLVTWTAQTTIAMLLTVIL